jgi:galactokinase
MLKPATPKLLFSLLLLYQLVAQSAVTTEAGLIESAASASIVIRFFQKLNKIPMAKNASLN